MKSAGLLLLVGLLVFCAELSLISGQPDICRLPKVEGSCFALISRYFFNTRTKKCEKFSYGGCRGNANNFETLEKCRRTCEWKPGRCPKPIETGLCKEFCRSDHSCPGKQKCCSNSCGHSCKNPILLVEP